MKNGTVLLRFPLSEVHHCLQLLISKVLPDYNGKDSAKVISSVCATCHCCFVIIFLYAFLSGDSRT